MSIEEQLGRWAREGLDAPAPDGPHIDDETLARVADGGGRLDSAQRAHLARCVECRDVLGVTAALPVAAPEPKRAWRWPLVLVPALAAAAGVLFALRPAPPEAPGYAVRGHTNADAASVTVLATGLDGRRRVLEAGGAVHLGERLGFRYGNPSGEAQTLTILGWDGERVHWYYPEAEGQPAAAIESGPSAVSRRLPFDVRLAPDHAAGPLTIAAGFDVPPAELAAYLRSGSKTNARIVEIPLQISSAP